MRSPGLSKVVAFYLLMGSLGLAARPAGHVAPVALWPAGGPLRLCESIALGLCVGLLLALASRLAAAYVPAVSRLAESFRERLAGCSALHMFAVSLLGGMSEELVFRGVVQPSVGLLLTAAIFGAMHVGPSPTCWCWAAMAAVAGLVFGGLSTVSGALVAPIVAHVTVNFVNFRHLAARRPSLVWGFVAPRAMLFDKSRQRAIW